MPYYYLNQCWPRCLVPYSASCATMPWSIFKISSGSLPRVYVCNFLALQDCPGTPGMSLDRECGEYPGWGQHSEGWGGQGQLIGLIILTRLLLGPPPSYLWWLGEFSFPDGGELEVGMPELCCATNLGFLCAPLEVSYLVRIAYAVLWLDLLYISNILSTYMGFFLSQ